MCMFMVIRKAMGLMLPHIIGVIQMEQNPTITQLMEIQIRIMEKKDTRDLGKKNIYS